MTFSGVGWLGIPPPPLGCHVTRTLGICTEESYLCTASGSTAHRQVELVSPEVAVGFNDFPTGSDAGFTSESWIVFWALHTGAGRGGHVHGDMAPRIRCTRGARLDRHACLQPSAPPPPSPPLPGMRRSIWLRFTLLSGLLAGSSVPIAPVALFPRSAKHLGCLFLGTQFRPHRGEAAAVMEGTLMPPGSFGAVRLRLPLLVLTMPQVAQLQLAPMVKGEVNCRSALGDWWAFQVSQKPNGPC